MFQKRQNSLSRHFVSEGKIAMKDILPLESKMAESANYLAGHGQAGFEKEQMSSVHGWLWAGCCGLRAVQA